MAPLLGYFSLYTTRQSDHFITAAKKSMSRKKNHQLKCFVSPDSTFLLFSCIQNCNETKIIKKPTQYKCPGRTTLEYRRIRYVLLLY